MSQFYILAQDKGSGSWSGVVASILATPRAVMVVSVLVAELLVVDVTVCDQRLTLG